MDGQTNRQTDRIAISIWRVSMMTRDNKSRFFFQYRQTLPNVVDDSSTHKSFCRSVVMITVNGGGEQILSNLSETAH